MRKRLFAGVLSIAMIFSLFASISVTAFAVNSVASEYSFENNLQDNTSLAYASGYGNCTYVPGIEGNALYLDGTSYVSLPSTLGSNVDKLTLSFWIKGTGDNEAVLLEAFSGNELAMQITMPDQEGIVNWTVGDDLVRRLPEACFYKDEWNFWAFVFDGAEQSMRIYINGIIVSTIFDTATVIPDIDSIYLGRAQNGTKYYTGAIDELVFQKAALSTEEIQALMRGERAYDPKPANGSALIEGESGYSISWSGASNALSYNLYLAQNAQVLETADTSSAAFVANTMNPSAVLTGLQLGTKYYWRVDTVFSEKTVKGQIWHFTAMDWDAQHYFDKGTELLATIERDFRIPQYDGYFEESGSTAWSYVWPNTIHLMALAKMAELHPEMYIPRIDNYVLQLDIYRTNVNGIVGYDCVGNPTATNRFYDDNAWMASALLDIYAVTGNSQHLSRAIDAYNFALSGEDTSFGGGIKWKETQYDGDPAVMKGISSTAGACYAAIKLYEITNEAKYLEDSQRLMTWMLNTLQDEDGIILNSVDATGVNSVKWSYNTGVPISALVKLYNATGNQTYLDNAIQMGHAAAALWLDTDTGAIIDAGCFAFTLYQAWMDLYSETNDKYWLELAAIVVDFLENSEDANGRYPLNWQDEVTGAQPYWGLLYSASVANVYLCAANCGAREVITQDVISSNSITATASSEWPGAGAVNTVNASGLEGVKHDNSSTATTMWHTQAGGGGQANPYAGLPTGAAWIVYTFDKQYQLGRMSIWNFNQYGLTTRGLRNVEVYYSQNNQTWNKLGDYTIPQAAGSTNYSYNYQIDFGGVPAKYVAIIADVQNGNWGDPSYYGLSEVRFECTPFLLAAYSCNDAQGTTLNDSGPNSYDATVVGGSWVGGALNLTGTTYVQVPAEVLSPLGQNVSISLWVYSRNNNSNYLLEAVNASGSRILGVHLPWYDTLYWDTGSTNRVQQAIASADYVEQWVHWVFVKNGQTGRQEVYKNGELFADAEGCTQSMSGITTFVIGASATMQNGFNGLIDDIRIYSDALSGSDILNLYVTGNQ